jgi:hypothetical protein
MQYWFACAPAISTTRAIRNFAEARRRTIARSLTVCAARDDEHVFLLVQDKPKHVPPEQLRGS